MSNDFSARGTDRPCYDGKNSTGKILFLQAFGIHTGGGKVLLADLLQEAAKHIKVQHLDVRLEVGLPAGSPMPETVRVRRSWLARVRSSLRIARVAGAGDILLCFNSLPPLRPTTAHVITYVHSAHFVGLHRGNTYGFITTLRIYLERVWFRFAARNSDEFWVQTRSVKDALSRQVSPDKIKIRPFVDEAVASLLSSDGAGIFAGYRSDEPNEGYCFFYPADAMGHKNHLNLFRAWKRLADHGLTPRLVVTIDESEFAKICRKASLSPAAVPGIRAAGTISREAVFQQYHSSDALIFPSRAETFGIPLVEARYLGIPILAPERSYVRDICVPDQTFDPNDPDSICRAVCRAMGVPELTEPFLSAGAFVSAVLAASTRAQAAH
jgi:glycosyltransferase involved in cell wall biosynthesis